MKTILKRIEFKPSKHILVGYLLYPERKNHNPGILFIQGGGKKEAVDKLKDWQQYLGERGYSSFLFAATGTGESEGVFEDGTLENREKEAKVALNIFMHSGLVNPNRICIIGTSMGGHIASKLATLQDIKVLILQSPAAYAIEAENKKLNSSFTEAISKENSWKNSTVFSSLKKFRGRMLLLYAENDTLIPEGIKHGYKSSLKEKDEFIIIPNGGHYFLGAKNDNESRMREKVFRATYNF